MSRFSEADYTADTAKVIANAAATGRAEVTGPDGLPRVVVTIPTVDLPVIGDLTDELNRTAIRLRGLESRLELEQGQEAVERARETAWASGLSYALVLERILGDRL